MMLGLSLSAFTTLHVIISLIAIVAGLVVMFGMLGSTTRPGLTAIFLLFTILTSVTGFMFPFDGMTPGIMIGILSLHPARDRLYRALRDASGRRLALDLSC